MGIFKNKKELPVNKLNYNLMALSNPIKWNAFGNDFEDIVIPIYPEIRDVKKLFKKIMQYSLVCRVVARLSLVFMKIRILHSV